MPKYQDLVTLARRAATRAAQYIRSAERPADPAGWDRKGMNDFVTHVDRTAEEIITEQLVTAMPGIPVLGEELAPETTTDGLVWVVDPLDGTTNYLHSFPSFAVSIAAVEDGVPVAGVVHDVTLDIANHASLSGGAFLDNQPIAVSATGSASSALIGTGFPFKHLHLLPQYMSQFATILSQASGIRRAGSAALDLASVARGHFDGFWELELAPWDVAAGVLLVREAGGEITDLDGQPAGARHGPIVAGNPMMHEWLLTVLTQT